MIALNPEPLLAAFLVGLLGGTHCFGMCGGIVGALSSGLSLELQTSRWRLVAAQLAYNGGRISSYVFAGVLLGLFGQQLGEAGLLQGFPLGRMIGGVVMILFGIYLAGWWQSLLWLEKAGAHLWKHIEPFGRRYIPVRSAGQAFLLGLVALRYGLRCAGTGAGQWLWRGGGAADAGFRAGYPACLTEHRAGL